MKIYTFPQRSPEWIATRRGVFTASELGMWAASPFCINLTVAEIIEELTRLSIPHKKNAKRDDLLALLPNAQAFACINPAAQEIIDSKLGEDADGDDQPPDYGDFWTKRGVRLEPDALDAYCDHVGE
ncbi:MAG: hypothetical protein JWO82_4224 [Akkermansiaceae bacterium]|nr:hypothetical protein [Akkermansiaceae bacterium]